MGQRIVRHRFVHAAVQLTTSLAERVESINGNLPNCWLDIWTLLQGMSLSQCFAGSSISSNMVLLQPSNAKQALLEETIQKKCFGDQLGLNCNYKRKDKSMDRKIRKNDWCCAILSAKLLFLLKAALTVLRWNCLYQQKIQTITLLAWWAKFQHFGGDFCVEICTLL